MAERYTGKNAEQAAQWLAERVGATWGHYRRDDDGNLAPIPGGWVMDYAPQYGGAVIEVMSDSGGSGVHRPFGMDRMDPRTFCKFVRGIHHGLDLASNPTRYNAEGATV